MFPQITRHLAVCAHFERRLSPFQWTMLLQISESVYHLNMGGRWGGGGEGRGSNPLLLRVKFCRSVYISKEMKGKTISEGFIGL